MPDEARATVSAGEVGMFLLEVVGLIGIGRLGWTAGTTTPWSLALSAFFVAIASAIWTLFRTRGFVPNGADPVVGVRGPARAFIEYAFYAAGTLGLWVSGWRFASVAFAAGVAIVSVALRDRLAGLLSGEPPAPRRARE